MRRRRTLSLLAAILIAAAVGWVLAAANSLEGVELATVDARFDLRGTQPAPPGVVLVAIDDKTIQAGKGAVYPIDRNRDAAMIGKLSHAGAAVIAYDTQFTDASDDPDADDALVQAVHDAHNVVLGTADVGKNGTTGIFGGEDGLKYSGATPANTNLDIDSDGRVRRVAPEAERLETFALAAARLKAGHSLLRRGSDPQWIDFAGPTGTVKTVSFLDVEQGRVPAADLRGKVVVVGTTAPRRTEAHSTSTSDRMPEAEVHANAIATALAGFPVKKSGGLVTALLVLLLAALAPLAALRWGNRAALAAALVGLVAYLAISAWVFASSGTLLAVVPVAAAGLTGLVGALAWSDPERPPLNALLDRLTRGVSGNIRTRRLRALLLLGTILLSVVVALVLQGTKALDRTELGTVDKRFDVRGTQPPPSDVILVAIDDKTFAQPPRPRWPFDRSDYAKVVRHLAEAGAKVIAVDVQISEVNKENPKGDEELVEATRAAGNVVMATTEVDEHGAANVFFDTTTLSYSRAKAAISNFLPDSDERIRRMYFKIQNRISFAMAATRLARDAVVPTPLGETAWIDFAGPAATVKRLSFVDVRRGTFKASDVKGKVVVVGATAPILHDEHSTATTDSGLMAGPEVHANAIHTALAGFPLRSAPSWLNWLLVIALGAITPLVALRRGIVLSVAAGVAAVGLFLLGAQWAFNAGTIVSVVYPLVAGLMAILLSAAIHGLTVAFEREQARDAFARFVPEAVVDQVLADADGVRLGGVRGEATVMFSDLRGFTSFSETLEPERVIDSLNRYLTLMSEAILDHGGTLVAYMGDGIMAVFGAPLKQEDHADRALEAARDMLARMEEFNAFLRSDGLHDGFKMGIGLNSGPVMSGNVGSERRLEYTALGDTTNTAARLEGMTKGTPHQLFISDTTKQKLTRPVSDLVQVGEAEVRGRKAKVLLWSISDEEPEAPPVPQPERVEA